LELFEFAADLEGDLLLEGGLMGREEGVEGAGFVGHLAFVLELDVFLDAAEGVCCGQPVEGERGFYGGYWSGGWVVWEWGDHFEQIIKIMFLQLAIVVGAITFACIGKLKY
jgi:hypothetical protein